MLLYQRIAEKLEADIKKKAESTLPGIRTLAKQYDVSYNTMLKAVQHLADRGILDIGNKRRARVAGTAPDLPVPKEQSLSAADKLAGILEKQIRDGILKAGNPLPKIDYYVVENRVSRTTVTRAFTHLAAKGLVHKQGKSWIAGAPRPARSVSTPPSVLLLLPNEHFWVDMTTDPRESSRFAIHFISEAEKQGINLIPVFIREQRDKNLRRHTVHGYAGIRKLIRDLGSRYLGAMVPLGPREDGEIHHWIRWFMEFGQPVVWLDRWDDGPGKTPAHPRLMRLYPDLPRVGRRTAEILHAAGHRVIGVPRFFYHHHMDTILAAMEEHSRRRQPGLVFKERRESSVYMKKSPRGLPPRRAFRELKEKGIPLVRRVMKRLYRENPEYFAAGGKSDPYLWTRVWRAKKELDLKNFVLVWQTPVLTPLVRDRSVTALVCPGNKYTRFFYWWLSEAGLDVPGDISVISVDNCYDYHPYPVSSIDLGFDHLGYAALHRFIEDIPVPVDKHSGLKGRITYHDRGSVAAPPEHIRTPELEGELI